MSYIVAWSGGKDCCLACYKAIQKGYAVSYLINFIRNESEIVVGTGCNRRFVQMQSESVGIPLMQNKIKSNSFSKILFLTRKCFGVGRIHSAIFKVLKTYAKYKRKFIKPPIKPESNPYPWDSMKEIYRTIILGELKRGKPIEGIITGDFDCGAPNLVSLEQICDELGIKLIKPLVGQDKEKMVLEFISAGFEAVIANIDERLIPEKWLGKTIDRAFLEFLKEAGLDIAGEKNEYQSIVTNGPIFKKAIKIKSNNKFSLYGRIFLDMDVS
jgi:diphthine-ammonia ligase